MTFFGMEITKVEKIKKKPRQENLVLYLKHTHIVSSSFLIVSHQYESKIFGSKFHDFWHKNLPKLETNPI